MAVVTKKLGSTVEVTGVYDELMADEGDVSGVIDPGSGNLSNETHMNLLFKINSGSAWGAGDKIADVYLIETVQDSDASSTDREEHYGVSGMPPTFPQESFVGSIVAVDNTLNEYYILRDVPMPAYKFRVAVHNTDDSDFDGIEINLQPWKYEIA